MAEAAIVLPVSVDDSVTVELAGAPQGKGRARAFRRGDFIGRVQERFERFYIPEPNSGCWLWEGGCNKQGYGKFSIGCRTLFTHRAAWLIYRGVEPADLHILHKCDTPSCVNPDHLFVGTHAKNMADKVLKGRQFRPVGSRNGHAKLSDDQVRELRSLKYSGLRVADIAAKFSISQPSASDVLNGRTYADVR